MQNFTSANTSLNQIPCTAKHIDYKNETLILDYGCGKFDAFNAYVWSQGCDYIGYDKFNRTGLENILALASSPSLVTCNNVLNVIDNEDVINGIIREIASYKVKAIFCVYEGNKSGIGKQTKQGCYQRNMKASDYVPMLEKYFHVVRKGNILICYPM